MRNQTSFQLGHESYNKKDEIGNRYGKLVVIAKAPNSKYGLARWYCECDCGGNAIRTGTNLRHAVRKRNSIPSCGCAPRSGHAPYKRSYRSYKDWAHKKKLEFQISFEQFKTLIHLPCHYCKQEPYIEKFAYHRRRYSKGDDESAVFHGIDKVNPAKGYINNNIVTCCVYCNRAKSDLTIEEFKQHIIRLYEEFIICDN